jgi:hypothetical protein
VRSVAVRARLPADSGGRPKHALRDGEAYLGPQKLDSRRTVANTSLCALVAGAHEAVLVAATQCLRLKSYSLLLLSPQQGPQSREYHPGVNARLVSGATSHPSQAQPATTVFVAVNAQLKPDCHSHDLYQCVTCV